MYHFDLMFNDGKLSEEMKAADARTIELTASYQVRVTKTLIMLKI